MASDKLEPPKHSKGDTAHALAKAGISAVPIIGGPGAELFQHIVQPPLEKRRIGWMGYVCDKLIELESRGVDVAQLSEDPARSGDGHALRRARLEGARGGARGSVRGGRGAVLRGRRPR